MTFSRGLSFTELLVAISILFFTSIAILQLYVATERYSLRARESWVASFLAQSKIESMLPLSASMPINKTGRFPSPYRDYEYQVEVTPFKQAISLIRVTVNSPSGAKTSLTLLK